LLLERAGGIGEAALEELSRKASDQTKERMASTKTEKGESAGSMDSLLQRIRRTASFVCKSKE
jgi:hypothetical protein